MNAPSPFVIDKGTIKGVKGAFMSKRERRLSLFDLGTGTRRGGGQSREG